MAGKGGYMRHGWLGLLFAFILFGMSQAQALAIYEALSDVYRIKVAECSQDPKARVLTGFRVADRDGIITALHGVVDCKSITARSDDKKGNNKFRKLTIVEVDIERDVALLRSDDMKHAPAGGLEVAPSTTPKGVLHVMGYPEGFSSQRPLVKVELLGSPRLKERIPNDSSKAGLEKRKSPSLEIEVLDLQASLLPGHSGAPLLTEAGQVYGVVNGGLDQGAIEVSWAIPWHDIDLHLVEDEEDRLLALARNYPFSDLSFSSTFPDYPTVELDLQDLPTEVVHAYRATTFMAMSGSVEDVDVTGWLGFETNYNEVGNQRSLAGVELWQAFDQEELQDYLEEEAYLIFSNQDHYLRLDGFQGECLKLDEIPETMADFVELTDEMILTPIEEEDLTLASYLGTEEINGENSHHYLLLEPMPLDETETGPPIGELVGLEFWVTVEANHLRKISAEVVFNEDSSTSDQPLSGDMYMEIEYFDINTDVTVDLPLACQNVSPTSSSPQSASSHGQEMITEPISVEHNVSGLQGPGMLIKPTVTVDNLADMSGVAIARIFYDYGMPVLSYSPETGNISGIYQAWTPPFTPPFESEEFKIFIPYKDLSLTDDVHNLKFQVFIYDISTKTVLAESDSYDFSLRQETDIAGNRTWFINEYSGFSGLTVAGQTEVSPLERDVGHFLSQAFEAETWAYWYEDPSVAEPYFSGNALLDLGESIESFQQQGLVLYAIFDEQNSFIVDMSVIDDNTVEVNVCEAWAETLVDQSREPVDELPPFSLIPLTLTLEQTTGSWWLITDVVLNPVGLSCEFAGNTITPETIVSADNTFDTPIVLELGTSSKFKISETGKVGYFQFTPTTTGIYNIATMSEPDSLDQGWMLFESDAFEQEIQRCDNDEPRFGTEQCLTEGSLKANNTYYFGVANFTGNQANDAGQEVIFTVTIALAD
jgi:hypothetical protein